MNIDLRPIYYALQVRAVGHTTVMIKGTENYDMPFFLVAHTNKYAEELQRLSNNRNAIPISVYDMERTRGTRRPIIFDHWAIQLILEQYMRDIDEKNLIISEQHKKISAQIKLLKLYEGQLQQLINLQNMSLFDIIKYWWKHR